MKSATQPISDGLSTLSRSKFFQEHRRAFSEALGLPVTLHASGEFHIDPENTELPEFCRAMALENAQCSRCWEEHRRLQDPSGSMSRTMTCFSGLTASAVPVVVSGRPVAYLHTGHVFLDTINERQLRRVDRVLRRRIPPSGTEPEPVPVIPGDQYRAKIKVLEVLARQLAEEAEHLPPTRNHPAVTRAMTLLRAHSDRAWTLAELARACHMSPNYLSEMFRHSTGQTLTDFLAAVRIGHARRLLSDPGRRISEIAHSVGFRSLSQFNRVFQKTTGTSPTEFRKSKIPPLPSAV